ncbi:MAG: putative lipid II flippase FtsW [Candidatus Sumerlaeaceae bacterium]|nr:putative lipid II flippase FtsW [Candidatus Sumerlaeaceae bacterium]
MRPNTTWLLFVVTLMLVTTGIVMVYSSSAAIAKRDERVAKMRAQKEALKNSDKTLANDPRFQAAATPSLDEDEDNSLHSFTYLQRQAIFTLLGIIGLLVAYRVDYEHYRKLAVPLLVVSFIALLLVYVPGVGSGAKGARRWIGLGLFKIQASEVAKLAMVIYMAHQLNVRQKDLKYFFRGFLPMMGLLGVFMLAIVAEPDLGACIVLGGICFTMWFVAGMRPIHLATLFILAIPAAILAILIEPFRVQRIIAFMNPEDKELIRGSGYQLYQSLIAVGSGGLSGLGLGEGPQKYLFLSEAYTDFIFAVICEEFGLIGATIIIALYVFFVVQGIRVASHAPDLYSCLLATGATAMIGIPAFFNMAVVTGLVPTKGLGLPLVSYGGSSLIINMVAIGILMNVSRFVEITAATPRRVRASFA